MLRKTYCMLGIILVSLALAGCTSPSEPSVRAAVTQGASAAVSGPAIAPEAEQPSVIVARLNSALESRDSGLWDEHWDREAVAENLRPKVLDLIETGEAWPLLIERDGGEEAARSSLAAKITPSMFKGVVDFYAKKFKSVGTYTGATAQGTNMMVSTTSRKGTTSILTMEPQVIDGKSSWVVVAFDSQQWMDDFLKGFDKVVVRGLK